MSRKMSRITALKLALDAMCAFNNGNLSEECMEAIDVVTDMCVKLQLDAKKQKQKRESQKFYQDMYGRKN